MSSWMSCLYCSLWSAQLWSRLLSGCFPNNGGGAVNVFQSNLKGIFVDDCSRYLASRLFGKFRGKGVDEIWLIDGVDGSDNVSGSDDDVVVSVEISIGSFIKFGSPCVNDCVVQYGSRDVWFRGVTMFRGDKGIVTYLFRCWC